MSLLSMVIPCYNHGRYLRDTLNSLFGGETCLGVSPGQTIKEEMEVIVVDDCSTDDTPQIIELIRSDYPTVIFLKTEKNSGTPGANNTGMRVAKGDLIATMNADDMREPESLQWLVEPLLANNKAFTYDDVLTFSAENGKSDKVWKIMEYDFDVILRQNQIHAGICFPRKAFVDTGGYPEIMRYGREDWAFNVALGLHGYCGIHIPKAGYLYRREGQNRTLTNASEEWQRKFAEQMNSLYPRLYAGERPMGCCGGSRSRSVDAPQGAPASRGDASLPGAEGMTKLFYNGEGFGNVTFFGPATGTSYKFSAGTRVRLVANSDLHTSTNRGFLDLFAFGKPLFSVYVDTEVTPAPPAPVPDEKVKPYVPPTEQAKEAPTVNAAPSSERTAGSPVSSLVGVSVTVAKKLQGAGVSVIGDLAAKSYNEVEKITGWTPLKAKMLVDLANKIAGKSNE